VVLELASLAGVRLALVFFALMAAGVGGAVGVLIQRRGTPRRSTRSGVAAGVLVAGAVFAGVYKTSLGGYCRVELAGANLRLAHALSTCDAEIALARVATIADAPGVRPHLAVLELRLDDGRVFRSQSASRELVERARLELAARLAAERGVQPTRR
jgi:hypothetical protein